MTLYPHPNLLKVQHSYIWAILSLLIFVSFFYIIEPIVHFTSIFLLITFTLYFIKWNVNRFQKNIYTIEFMKGELAFSNKLYSKNEIQFSSRLLEKAYGIGTIQLGKHRLKGIYIADYRDLYSKLSD